MGSIFVYEKEDGSITIRPLYFHRFMTGSSPLLRGKLFLFMLQSFDILLAIERCHTAAASCGNRLTITRILNIATGEHAGHIRLRGAWFDDDISVHIGIDLTA